jgi:hypothetical protein
VGRMTTRRFLIGIPAIAQWGAVAALLWLPAPYGVYAQLMSLAIMLLVFAAFGIGRLKELRSRYRKLRRDRDTRREAFARFVAANTGAPPQR